MTQTRRECYKFFLCVCPARSPNEEATLGLAGTFERAARLSRPRTMEILRQLGELFWQAVPTVLIVFLFYLFLRAHFFRPMEQVLSERKARTEGTRRAAESAQATTQEKLRAYQEGLRKARADIYAEREQARRAILDERTALLRATRNRTSEKIRAAKERISAEMAAARTELEMASTTLAEEIAHAILQPRPPAPQAPSEAR